MDRKDIVEALGAVKDVLNASENPAKLESKCSKKETPEKALAAHTPLLQHIGNLPDDFTVPLEEKLYHELEGVLNKDSNALLSAFLQCEEDKVKQLLQEYIKEYEIKDLMIE